VAEPRGSPAASTAIVRRDPSRPTDGEFAMAENTPPTPAEPKGASPPGPEPSAPTPLMTEPLPGGPDGPPPEGAEMLPMDAPPEVGSVPYRRLFRWAWFIVRATLGVYLLNIFLTLFSQTLQQYTVQLLAVVVSGLQTGSAPAGGGQGFLAGLLPTSLGTAAILFAVLSLVGVALTFGERITNAWSDNVMTVKLQQNLHDKLLVLGHGYHGQHDLGETATIVSRYSAGSVMVLQDLISFPLVRGIGLVTAVVFLLNSLQTVGSSPLWMRLAMLGALLALPLGGWWLSGRLRGAFARVRDAELEVADELQNSLALPLEVQVMGAQAQRGTAFAARLRRYLRAKLAAGVRNEIATQFQGVTPVVLQVMFLIYGVFFALKNPSLGSAGAILAIYYFVPQVVQPVQQILQFVLGLQSAWPQVESVIEILEAEPEVTDRPGAREVPAGAQGLEVDHVTFAYAVDGKRQLEDLSFTFAPGRVYAIVARAGAGKSTLLNLAARLRDPQGGALRIGGVDLRDLRLGSVRRRVAKVSQFPLFIADTVRQNFLLARADATDADIEAVCRRTGLWDVLVNAAGPGGRPLDYVLPRAVGEGLSGGQRRLLSVTRALLLQPSVLLLDEPTTGIDAIGRQMLVPVLREACKGLTVLLVDHDMEFVRSTADVVCVLEDGTFTQVGPPEELAARPGLFQRLLQSTHGEDSGAAAPSGAAPGVPSDPTSAKEPT
jgi:ABC-type multidrug transport system fused ATPase/permease subunit